MRRRVKVAACMVVGVTIAMAGPALAKGKPGGGGGGTGATAFKPGLHLTADAPYGLVQGEPSIQVDSAGRMYVAAPASQPIGCEFWRVPQDLSTQHFTAPPDLGTGGGDCDLALNPGPNGFPTIAYTSLNGTVNFTVNTSVDGGDTWTPPNVTGTQWAGTDRQWLGSDGLGRVYMSYHILATNNIQVAVSNDGGATYTLANLLQTPGNGQAIDGAHILQAQMNNELGPIVVDRSSTAATKPVYTIFTAPDSAAENLTSGDGTTHTYNHDVFLASSTDGGVTWTDNLIYRGPDPLVSYDHIFPALSIDSDGGFWAAWASSEEHIYVTHAPPGSNGATGTWTRPARVDPLPPTNRKGQPTEPDIVANQFPWIVGGANGYADLVWYRGTSTDPATANMDTTNQWTANMAQLHWTQRSGLKIASNVVASDHVIHTGAMCTTGVACTDTDPTGANRALLDFFQVALTPDGRAAIAWADDHAQPPSAQIYVTVQCSGVSATTGVALTSNC